MFSSFKGKQLELAPSPKDQKKNNLDEIALEEVRAYVSVWIKSRTDLAKAVKLQDDNVLREVVTYLIKVSNEYSMLRVWTSENIKRVIWNDISSSQVLLSFVAGGSNNLIVTTLHNKEETDKLVNSIADGLTCMSGADTIVVDKDMQTTMPEHAVLKKAFESDRWLLFIYYIMRLGLSGIFLNGIPDYDPKHQHAKRN